MKKMKQADRPALPGTQRQRAYARSVLKVEPIQINSWKVYGGYGIHHVHKNSNGLSCDCEYFENTSLMCVHVLKVLFYLNPRMDYGAAQSKEDRQMETIS